MRRLLLDTNVAVWLLLGARDRLSARAAHALEDESNEIVLSAVSVWEIAIKRSIGKLMVGDGWATVLTSLDFSPMPVTSLHAAGVEHLPGHHRDPFDRLLVSQALVEGCELVSADARLGTYGVTRVW